MKDPSSGLSFPYSSALRFYGAYSDAPEAEDGSDTERDLFGATTRHLSLGLVDLGAGEKSPR